MKRYIWLLLPAVLVIAIGCHKQAQAPIPGQINSFDGWAYRIVFDAQATLQGVKGWEQCADGQWPAHVNFDGITFDCTKLKKVGFPNAARPLLFHAEQSYNLAMNSQKAYHAGTSSDTSSLQAALNALSADITALLTSTQKGGQ